MCPVCSVRDAPGPYHFRGIPLPRGSPEIIELAGNRLEVYGAQDFTGKILITLELHRPAFTFFSARFAKILLLKGLPDDDWPRPSQNLEPFGLTAKILSNNDLQSRPEFPALPLGDAMIGQHSCGPQGQMSQEKSRMPVDNFAQFCGGGRVQRRGAFWGFSRVIPISLVILRSAPFADRRIYGIVGSACAADKVRRSFGAKRRRLRMTVSLRLRASCTREFRRAQSLILSHSRISPNLTIQIGNGTNSEAAETACNSVAECLFQFPTLTPTPPLPKMWLPVWQRRQRGRDCPFRPIALPTTSFA